MIVICEMIDTLQRLIREVISASPAYMKKEKQRQAIQDDIVRLVQSGGILNQKDLDAYFASLSASKWKLTVTALKSVPFQVWSQLAKPPQIFHE